MLVGCREGFSKRKNTVRACGAGTEVLGAKKDAEFGDEAEADTRPSGETASEKKRSRPGPWGLRNEVQRAYKRPEIYAKSVFLHPRTHTGTFPVRNQSFLCKNILKESLNC